ncbi:MAG TPA: hypothetical protein DCY06_05770 [Bacteroidetes bacterium]|nr:hypothetical protein [Bacteroidota bacterium]
MLEKSFAFKIHFSYFYNVIKTFLKYFSILLIAVLIQSNFSFALNHMLCKMSEVQTACECGVPCENEIRYSAKESGCCSVIISEISNKNILEINKLSFIKDIYSQFNERFLNLELLSDFPRNFSKQITHFKPPADIPILFSHILI